MRRFPEPQNFFGSYGSRGATTMADHSFYSLFPMMKNEMIKKHDLSEFDKENLSQSARLHSKDYNKCTKYIGVSCGRANNVLLGMVK